MNRLMYIKSIYNIGLTLHNAGFNYELMYLVFLTSLELFYVVIIYLNWFIISSHIGRIG